jgi:hypothetical protein
MFIRFHIGQLSYTWGSNWFVYMCYLALHVKLLRYYLEQSIKTYNYIYWLGAWTVWDDYQKILLRLKKKIFYEWVVNDSGVKYLDVPHTYYNDI